MNVKSVALASAVFLYPMLAIAQPVQYQAADGYNNTPVSAATPLPVTGTFTPSGTTTVVQPTAANLQATITPGQRTLVALDVATVTTGGTAVTALTAGHRTAGGFLNNPKAATVDLCINEIATASGTTSAGSLTCIAPGQSYTLTPASTAVSVITSDSSHPFSGYGLN